MALAPREHCPSLPLFAIASGCGLVGLLARSAGHYLVVDGALRTRLVVRNEGSSVEAGCFCILDKMLGGRPAEYAGIQVLVGSVLLDVSQVVLLLAIVGAVVVCCRELICVFRATRHRKSRS